jgi:hypothetical protein
MRPSARTRTRRLTACRGVAPRRVLRTPWQIPANGLKRPRAWGRRVVSNQPRSVGPRVPFPEQSSVCLVVALRPTGGSVLKHRSGGRVRARRPSAVQSSLRSNRADHATGRVGATRPHPAQETTALTRRAGLDTKRGRARRTGSIPVPSASTTCLRPLGLANRPTSKCFGRGYPKAKWPKQSPLAPTRPHGR